MPWWNKKYGKEAICAITRTRLRPGRNKLGKKYSVFLSCGHGFCRTALLKMYLTTADNRCPLCRKIFDVIKCIQ